MPDYSKLDAYLDDYLHNTFRPYQKAFYNFGVANKRTILSSPAGSGKTLMVLSTTLQARPNKILILCSKNALWTWQKELDKWFKGIFHEDEFCIVSDTAAKRDLLWKSNKSVFVCTYATYLQDVFKVLQLNWDVIIFDEYHRSGLRSYKSIITKKLSMLCKKTPSLRFATATPTSKGHQEHWPTLHHCNPKAFANYWSFVNTFCATEEGAYGPVIVGPKNVQAFTKLSSPHLSVLDPGEVEKYLPALVRSFPPVHLEKKYRVMYDKLADELVMPLTSGAKLMIPSQLASLVKLRQFLACPKILDPELKDFGVGMNFIADKIQDADDYHCVIFTPFRPAITYLHEFFSQNYPKIPRQHLWGNMEPAEVKRNVLTWKQNRGIMFCTTKFSQSFELDTSDTCYFLGYEYDQNDNIQAEGRLRRLTNPRTIHANYITHLGTIDERVLEILNNKTHLGRITDEVLFNIITTR